MRIVDCVQDRRGCVKFFFLEANRRVQERSSLFSFAMQDREEAKVVFVFFCDVFVCVCLFVLVKVGFVWCFSGRM